DNTSIPCRYLRSGECQRYPRRNTNGLECGCGGGTCDHHGIVESCEGGAHRRRKQDSRVRYAARSTRCVARCGIYPDFARETAEACSGRSMTAATVREVRRMRHYARGLTMAFLLIIGCAVLNAQDPKQEAKNQQMVLDWYREVVTFGHVDL